MTKGREPTADERTAILLEEMRSQFKAVTETVLQIKSDVGELKKDQKKTDQKIDNIQLEVKVIRKDVAEIKSEFPYAKNILLDHEHRIKDLESKAS